MDHIFSYWNNSKLCKFCMFAISHSLLNYFTLIFQISLVQWLNCRNLKDELNHSYNGGGVVYLLQSGAIHFNLTVATKTAMYWKSYKKLSILFTIFFENLRSAWNTIKPLQFKVVQVEYIYTHIRPIFDFKRMGLKLICQWMSVHDGSRAMWFSERGIIGSH